jgi:arginyl-tRNA synthetase
MKHQIEQLVRQALAALHSEGALGTEPPEPIRIERARDKSHGDFACNVAMVLAKAERRKPRELAEQIAAALPLSDDVARLEVAGPGFINFHLAPSAYHHVIGAILDSTDQYGRSDVGNNLPVQVEFVSANPTGPLHVGHGRGAAYGATVADLLQAIGFRVHREYYVNDAGRQMDILAASVWLRYLDLCGEEFPFPANGYKGDYVWDVAATLHRNRADAYRVPAAQVFSGLPADAPAGGDKEQHIDAVIDRARELLGAERYLEVFDLGLNTILADIRQDLHEFGVDYDEWYSERRLVESGAVDRAVERLKQAGHLYQQDGAWWFRTSEFGDEKDRVVVRDNGQKTYFASDIAYHADKLERGFRRVIDVWGADHHGYVPRVRAALQALGDDERKLDVLLVARRCRCRPARATSSPCASCATKWATTPRAFSMSCANANNTWTSTWTWPNPSPATIQCITFNTPMRGCAA